MSLLSCKTFFSVDWWVWCVSVTGFVCVSMEFHKVDLEKNVEGVAYPFSLFCPFFVWDRREECSGCVSGLPVLGI